MKWLQVFKLMVQLKSKTLTFGALVALIPVIDTGFFGNTVGMWIVAKFMWLCGLLPFLPPITEAQATSFLLVVIGGAVVWLRKVTSVGLDQK